MELPSAFPVTAGWASVRFADASAGGRRFVVPSGVGRPRQRNGASPKTPKSRFRCFWTEGPPPLGGFGPPLPLLWSRAFRGRKHLFWVISVWVWGPPVAGIYKGFPGQLAMGGPAGHGGAPGHGGQGLPFGRFVGCLGGPFRSFSVPVRLFKFNTAGLGVLRSPMPGGGLRAIRPGLTPLF